jgi:uncharacterized circularly permuted ATP-grasp superfamily protein/uncharacterized alpha-E superfamily protein
MSSNLLEHYERTSSRYDELLKADGEARPHWQAMLNFLSESAPEAMEHRVQAVQRQVRENGVTYNVYADPLGTDRPWDLDVVPMILSAEEWAEIEAGVIQRAGLMNKILVDVYGDQKLLADGHLPASLVHGHSGFLRPCHGIKHLDGVALHTYAVDLARSPDGRWWVVNDRTQAPSGAGYALENRMAISRAFPEMFRDLKIERLAGFFIKLRDSLAHWGRSCAPYLAHPSAANERPLTVLLTPGPYNETYYEQAFLARYLGFPLIHGNDLMVRDGFVWLKTLSGLRRVHVILRRLDDDYCDPLELRSDSALGVAGLTEAARRGTVLIANSLGSNLLESGALLGFLPKLCDELLGEPLKIPSIATWWCGEPAALSDVISRIGKLVFKPSFPQLRQALVFGEDLDEVGRIAFIDRLRAEPHNFVAQEQVRVSQAPTWNRAQQAAEGISASIAAGLNSRVVSLRVFACATPNGYAVMPGGLTRVATGSDARVVAMQRGGASKDTWVMAEGLVNPVTLLPRATANQDLVRAETHLASRTVENLYWFGRYAERCDNTARLMRRCLDTLIEANPETRGGEWATLVALCQWQELLEPPAPASSDLLAAQNLMPSDAQVEARLLKAVYDAELPGLAHHVKQLFRVAFNLRERLSTDNWRSLNQMLQRLGDPGPDLSIGDALALLDEAAVSLMTLAGFTLDGMTRDMGWRFLSMGRRIERLQFMCSVLQHALTMPANSGLDWLLVLGDSLITYRSRYMARPEWLPVLDLLILDTANPRAIIFQLEGLIGALKRVAAVHGPSGEEIFEPLLAQLSSLDPGRDLRPGGEELLTLLRSIYSASYQVSERLASRFFSYAGHIDASVFKT